MPPVLYLLKKFFGNGGRYVPVLFDKWKLVNTRPSPFSGFVVPRFCP
jgi:hypothetical protein